MTHDKIEDDDNITISIENAEKILVIRDFILNTEGRKLGFEETINYIIEELVDIKNILDELHDSKKKNV